MTEKSRILVVDDTPLNIRVLVENLRDEYAVIAANSGAKALELCAREAKPDLILLDIMMPEMDGYEVIQRLKKFPSTASIPVLFVTALSEDRDEAKGLALGAADYITKPFNPALVRARVKNHLELKRHRDHLESEVKRRTEELLDVRQSQARLEGELETARRLQLSMLPAREHKYGESGVLAAYLNPARSVGGDLFDYSKTADGKALLVLGDVSDKGTSAALFMVKTLTLLRAFSKSEVRPDRLLAQVNHSLCSFNDEFMFVTLTCCLLDFSTGEMEWASGGHEPLLKFGGSDPPRYLEQENGPALGLMEDAEFPLQQTRLELGEGIVLYSDGVTEAQGSEEIEFGGQRLLYAVQKLEDPDPKSICQSVVEAVDLFVGGAEQFDDMAILVVRRGDES